MAGTPPALLKRPLQGVYELAGQAFAVDYASPQLADALAPTLEHLRRPQLPAGAKALRVEAWDGASSGMDMADLERITGVQAIAGVVENGTDHGATPLTRPRIYASDGRGLFCAYQPVGGAMSLLDAERGTAVYWTPDVAGLAASERSSPFRTILNWWLAPRGLQIVHAGGVAGPEGAVLLVGPGGSGKSTAALACLDGGLEYLGDDSVLCRAEPEPVAYCLYASGTVHGHSLQWFDSLPMALGNGERLAVEKALLLADGGLPGRVAISSRLRAICVVRVSGRPQTRLYPISGAQTIRALAPSSMLNLPGTGRQAYATLAALARKLPGFALESGTRLQEIPETIRRLLQDCDRPGAGTDAGAA